MQDDTGTEKEIGQKDEGCCSEEEKEKMNTQKVQVGLSVIVAIVAVCVLLYMGCNTFSHFPKADDMRDEDPSSCLDYVRCLYFSAKAKGTIDCGKPYDRCDKDRAWKDCLEAIEQGLPSGVTFQSCWDKKR